MEKEKEGRTAVIKNITTCCAKDRDSHNQKVFTKTNPTKTRHQLISVDHKLSFTCYPPFLLAQKTAQLKICKSTVPVVRAPSHKKKPCTYIVDESQKKWRTLCKICNVTHHLAQQNFLHLCCAAHLAHKNSCTTKKNVHLLCVDQQKSAPVVEKS